jgi:hypothetical protein
MLLTKETNNRLAPVISKKAVRKLYIAYMANVSLSSSEIAYIVHILSEYYLQELLLLEDPHSKKAKRLEKIGTVVRLLALKFPPEYEQA